MKTMLVALTLTVLPSLSMAMGCSGYGHDTTASISCADGMTFDADQQRCIAVTTG
ncbi:MAG: hypothetical protein AAFN59_13470 [Pseudomonadota bacterium]